jgi:pimeloyl-ACP methyl ester carboxylesterase
MTVTHERHVSVPGGSIYVKVWVPETESGSIPLVLLHDSLGCVGLWRNFPNALAERLHRPVVAYDRLGFGQSSLQSDLPSRGFVENEARTLVPVLDALSLERAILFGHSVGGSMALCAAAALPERVGAVISESAQAFLEPRTFEGLEAARRTFSNPAQVERLRRWHGERAEWVLRAWLDVWTSPPFADWSLTETLPKVRCPVLTIHGDRDEYGSLAFPETIARFSGGEAAMLILEGGGHIPHREQPETVLSAVETFLNGHF